MPPLVILDGGLGRHLKDLGAPFRQPQWSALALMEAPSFVTKAHTDFIESGANIITTNSYAVVPFHIGREAFDSRATELIRLSGELAVEACKSSTRPVRIAGSIPPLFGSYQPELYNKQEAAAMTAIFTNALEDYVDFFIAETLSCWDEIENILHNVGNDSKPLWISLSLEPQAGHSDVTLRDGTLLIDILQRLIPYTDSFDGLLFNCCQPKDITQAFKHVQASFMPFVSAGFHVGAYPNAFDESPNNDAGAANETYRTIRDDLTPEELVKLSEQWKQLGATVIGGCCGIGPQHIRALAQAERCVAIE
eukprot:TRINITY_DN21008_c0_g1_i1.p1 TRINITY_DN21008_c0_g1~~TRINITY_DN21008_c0_g1_i1.p1  ORF type:complete len:308 (+),score=45.05 TRINITY_DN21008_c0_g1_i1:53-976(+)